MANLYSSLQSVVDQYTALNGWKVSRYSNNGALLEFNMPSGRQYNVHIIKYDDTLEFSTALSYGRFRDKDHIPDWMSTLLMEENSKSKIGFWCIEKVGEEYRYEYMYNVPIDWLTATIFGTIVRTLLTKCDDFDDVIRKTAEEYSHRH